MATSKTRTIVNAVDLMRGQIGGTVYNDRLVKGGRSVKVTGWNHFEYDMAKIFLEQAGCIVKKLTVTRRTARGQSTAIRLHVKE